MFHLQAARWLHLVARENLEGLGDLNHLTNWCAITVPVGHLTTQGVHILKKTTLRQCKVSDAVQSDSFQHYMILMNVSLNPYNSWCQTAHYYQVYETDV